MKKGISPLVATVLLIAITMAVAAVLANWVSNYTEKTLPTTNCIGGEVGVISSDYPKWENQKIIAVVESRFVELKDFKFVVLMNDDSTNTYNAETSITLQPGTIGTIKTATLPINKAGIKSVQILTSCPDVKSGWYALR